jgi:hypothetical protein
VSVVYVRSVCVYVCSVCSAYNFNYLSLLCLTLPVSVFSSVSLWSILYPLYCFKKGRMVLEVVAEEKGAAQHLDALHATCGWQVCVRW